MKEILTGSRVFFDGLNGFEPKDSDFIQVVEKEDANFNWQRQLQKNGIEIFEVVRLPKEKWIEHYVKSGSKPLGMFLTPAFAQEFGITIADLEQLRPMRERLDAHHEYLGIIYDAYLENGSFTLTDAQRMAAFENYKAAREKKE